MEMGMDAVTVTSMFVIFYRFYFQKMCFMFHVASEARVMIKYEYG